MNRLCPSNSLHVSLKTRCSVFLDEQTYLLYRGHLLTNLWPAYRVSSTLSRPSQLQLVTKLPFVFSFYYFQPIWASRGFSFIHLKPTASTSVFPAIDTLEICLNQASCILVQISATCYSIRSAPWIAETDSRPS